MKDAQRESKCINRKSYPAGPGRTQICARKFRVGVKRRLTGGATAPKACPDCGRLAAGTIAFNCIDVR